MREACNQIFDLCVQALIFLADVINISYKEINVILFVIWMPLHILVLHYILYKKRTQL